MSRRSKAEPDACAREPAQIGRVFDALGYDCKSHITYHINLNLLEEDCCIASFLRGAFLMGGTVAGPDKKSHLELKTTHQSLSGENRLMLDSGFIRPNRLA